MERDDLCVFVCEVFDELADFFGLRMCGRRQRQRRNRGGVDSKRPDQIDMIFHAVKISLFGLSGKFDVVDQTFVFYSVSDFEWSSGKDREERSPRPSVEIDNDIVGILPDSAYVFPEFSDSQLFWENENAVQVGMAFYEHPVGLVDDISDLGFGEALSESGDGRRCHNDIADPPEPYQEDALNPGWINLLFLSLAQWSPHR